MRLQVKQSFVRDVAQHQLPVKCCAVSGKPAREPDEIMLITGV